MASLYPSGLDSLPTTHQDSVGEIIHAVDIDNLADAVNKIEAELGVLPKGTFSSVSAKLTALYYGTVTTTQRNAITAGNRPTGMMVFNSTTNRYEYNSGSDATPVWSPVGPAGPWGTSDLVDGAVTTAKIADLNVTGAKIANTTIGDTQINTISPSKITGTAVVTSDSRLSDTRTPTDGTVTLAKMAANSVDASKIVDGSVANAELAALAVTDAKVATANKDGTAGTPSMRTLGTGAAQAAAGNDARFTDTRTPTDGTVTQAKFAYNLNDNRIALGLMMIEGVLPYNGFTTGSPQASLAVSTSSAWTVAIAAGRALVQGDDNNGQGMYIYTLAAGTTFTLPTTSSGLANPRLDQIVLQFNDSDFTGRTPIGFNFVQVVGTPTAGATLANRNGAAALPASALWLADVLVLVGDTGVVGGQIGDKRKAAGPGIWGEDNHRYRLGIDASGIFGIEQVV